MELHIKPEDKNYSDIEYLIEHNSVKTNLFKMFINGEMWRRDVTYENLAKAGFLARKANFIGTIRYSPFKYNRLEDKTIVLYNKK